MILCISSNICIILLYIQKIVYLCIVAIKLQKKQNIMKTLNIEKIVKIVVVSFIAVTLILVTINLFSDLTLLNRSF